MFRIADYLAKQNRTKNRVISALMYPFIMIGVLFLMMYFLLIRPQKKQRQELEARVASMEKGDEVVTSGGLHASVHHISDRTVTLKLAEGVFVPFEKNSIQAVIKKRSGSGDTKEQPEKK